jgi:putative (di)nucleoside polyphosphate hydrolase
MTGCYRLPSQYAAPVEAALHGQKQRWFRSVFGEDRELRLDTTDEPEFDSWRWVDYWTPVREVIY